jgi:hypothetical protein
MGHLGQGWTSKLRLSGTYRIKAESSNGPERTRPSRSLCHAVSSSACVLRRSLSHPATCIKLHMHLDASASELCAPSDELDTRQIVTKGAGKAASGGRRNFNELRAKISPERRTRNAAATKEMIAALPLQELRHARELTQATLAEAMECGQDEVSKLERRADVLVSTLRRYVEAMGGTLDIVATFPDGEVRISNLGELAAVDA